MSKELDFLWLLLFSLQFWPCMRMCWSVQLLAAPVRATLTATVTHTAGTHTRITVLHLCVCFCSWCSVMHKICYFPFCIRNPTYSCVQGRHCVSPHQGDEDLHGQQHAPCLIFILFFLFLHPSSLSGCPIAAAEKLSKGHDKPHISQPGTEHLKGSPNDRVLRWVIKKMSLYKFQQKSLKGQ